MGRSRPVKRRLAGRPPRAARSSRTADRLLLAAEREFAARGFAGARLEDIAGEVGLTRPSLLHHFPTKDALYATAVERLVTRVRAALMDGMATEGAFAGRLAATVGRFSDQMFDDPAPARLLVRELLDGKGAGERLLREQVVPLLELAERFLRLEGRDALPADLDVRAALLDLVGAVVFFAVMGDVRDTLWGASARRTRAAIRAHFVAMASRAFLAPPATAAKEAR